MAGHTNSRTELIDYTAGKYEKTLYDVDYDLDRYYEAFGAWNDIFTQIENLYRIRGFILTEVYDAKNNNVE